jgi:hypothetical protein
VLEGGYKIHGGIVSPFARSVASHVRGLVDGGISRELYNGEDLQWESSFERRMVEDKERRRQQKLDRIMQADLERRRIRAANAAASLVRQEQADASPVIAPLIEKLGSDNLEPTPMPEPTPVAAPGLARATREPVHIALDTAAASEGVEMDALQMLNEPLASATPLHQGEDAAQLPSDTNDGGDAGSEAEPDRKRKRPQVDYKALFEKMKSEEQIM